MPNIKGIDLSDGIKILSGGVGRPDVVFQKTNIPTHLTIEQAEAVVQQALQSQYEKNFLISSLRVWDRPDPDNLAINVRLTPDGKTAILTEMWVRVHIFSLDPLRYTVCCSDWNVPIPDNWWG